MIEYLTYAVWNFMHHCPVSAIANTAIYIKEDPKQKYNYLTLRNLDAAGMYVYIDLKARPSSSEVRSKRRTQIESDRV